jgi:hypothetical protein
MTARATAVIGQLVNLVVPGGGLILSGNALLGVLIAALFTLTANFALLASLLFPDDFSATRRGLGIGVAIGTYVGAQIRYAQSLRSQRRQAADTLRHNVLGAVRSALLAGRVDDAWQAIQPLINQVNDDLVVAYRVAQVLTAREGGEAALAAWERVRRLDRHRVYRQQVADNERALLGRAM